MTQTECFTPVKFYFINTQCSVDISDHIYICLCVCVCVCVCVYTHTWFFELPCPQTLGLEHSPVTRGVVLCFPEGRAEEAAALSDMI